MSGLSCSGVTVPAVASDTARTRSIGHLSHWPTASREMPITRAKAALPPTISIAFVSAGSRMGSDDKSDFPLMSSVTSVECRKLDFHHVCMDSLAERIKILRGEQSQAAFGKQFGVSRKAVSLWESGGNIDPKRQNLIVEKYNVSLDWLNAKVPVEKSQPQIVKSVAGSSPNLQSSNQEKRFLTGEQDLPILGHAKGGEDGFFIENGEIAGYTMRPYILNGVSDAYAVNIWDTSMEPAFKHGHIAWVHPRKPVKAGDDVVVQLHDGQALIKCLVRQTETFLILHQYKPDKDIRIPQENVKSIHLVVGSIRVIT